MLRSLFVPAFLGLSALAAHAADLPEGLDGKWRVMLPGAELKTGEPPMMEVKPDGSLSGSTGCNRYSGTLSFDGTTIAVSPLRMTKMACAPEAMKIEQQFLKALETPLTWSSALFGSGGTLSSAGHAALELVPPSEPVTITVPMPGGTDVSRRSVAYACGERTLVAEYIDAGAVSLASLQIGNEYILAANVLAASGARYAGGPYVWWIKGDEATLEDLTAGEDVRPLQCRVKS